MPPLLLNTNTDPSPLHIRRSRLIFILNSLKFRLTFIGNISHEAVSLAAVEPAGAEVERFSTEAIFFILAA